MCDILWIPGACCHFRRNTVQFMSQQHAADMPFTLPAYKAAPSQDLHPTLSVKKNKVDPPTWCPLIRTCPLSKFSFSSSRLLAPPVRRITLGIALGTCCMELFTRSIVVCDSNTQRRQTFSRPTSWTVKSQKLHQLWRAAVHVVLDSSPRSLDHLAFLSNTPV